MKKLFLVCFSILLLIFSLQYLAKPVEAIPQTRCPKNSFFPCREEVVQIINKAITPLKTLISNLTTKTDDLEKKVVDLETRVKALEEIAHCPDGMVPEIRFEGDTGPLKCKPAINLQPTTTPQPTIGPDSFQVDCDGSTEGEILTVTATANKSIKSCQYTINPTEEGGSEIPAQTPIIVTPNGSSCSFTESVCGRRVSLRLESFDSEIQECAYEPTPCNP